MQTFAMLYAIAMLVMLAIVGVREIAHGRAMARREQRNAYLRWSARTDLRSYEPTRDRD